MNRLSCILLLVFLSGSSSAPGQTILPLRGADLSMLPHVEAAGRTFTIEGARVNPLTALADQGLNTARLRLWHTPVDGRHGLADALALATRARAEGLDILLDIHYSDTWADPGHQAPPAAWAGLGVDALADSVRAYTGMVLGAMVDAGCSPSFVQLGNEVTQGMLWPHGRVGGTFDTPAQWENLATLLAAAVAGVVDAHPGAGRPGTMIHLDRGGDNGTCRWFFDALLAKGIEFDLIGLSYYPWWHGTLEDLERNLNDLATRYDKDIVVVETAYPWTLGWFDDTHNPVGLPEHLLEGFPATPEGQASFLGALREILHGVPRNRGRGYCWWEPAWAAAPGLGSSWENLTWFDDNGSLLPVAATLTPSP